MNRAMSISFCMNIFVALIIARSVRPPVHLISLHILYVCLHVYMLRHIYIYIYIFFFFFCSIALLCLGVFQRGFFSNQIYEFQRIRFISRIECSSLNVRRSRKDWSSLSYPAWKILSRRARTYEIWEEDRNRRDKVRNNRTFHLIE